MNLLELLAALLRSLSIISKDPSFGPKGETITSALSLAATAVEIGEEGVAALQDLVDKVEQMVKEGRNPTEAEWADLRARSDVAHSILQNKES